MRGSGSRRIFAGFELSETPALRESVRVGECRMPYRQRHEISFNANDRSEFCRQYCFVFFEFQCGFAWLTVCLYQS